MPQDRSDLPRLLVIVGPTAVGKTALSLDLAQRFDGEIVSADSRQVYVGMDIGTAKATPEEQRLVRHHLVDILAPGDSLTAGEFQRRAYEAIADIHARGRLPILVGGTGQYVAAVVDGWSIPEVAPVPEIRADLEAFAHIYGPAALHERLQSVDAVAAASIDYRNVRRVVRALEVFLATGSPISVLQQRDPPPYRILKIGLTMPRETLYQRIDARIDMMIQQGLIAEIEGLLRDGYTWELPAMSALGYREFRAYLAGEMPIEDAVALVRRGTRKFVRKQYNWFRLNDDTIHWLDLSLASPEVAVEAVQVWLSGR